MVTMSDCNMSEMSCVIFHNVPKNEIQGLGRERVEMMVESADDFRTQTHLHTNRQQPLQCTGSDSVKNRSHRSVLVCLVVLCVLLLTAVLCVLIYTNNHQFHNNNKNITQERDQLLTNNIKLTQERDQLTKEINGIFKALEKTERWRYFQFSLYYISLGDMNWNLSRRFCRERGSDLIIINNKEEQEFATKVTGVYGLWIGLSDSDEEGRWKWANGSTLTSGFWTSGEPNGGTNENCVESLASGWNDCSCFDKRKFICETNIV